MLTSVFMRNYFTKVSFEIGLKDPSAWKVVQAGPCFEKYQDGEQPSLHLQASTPGCLKRYPPK